MKEVLLIGKQLTTVPPLDQLVIKDLTYFAAQNLEETKEIFSANDIDVVIMGAGIDLDKRLEIVCYIFTASNTTSVHMKDRATGPEGFLPFINKVLTGLKS